MTKIFATTLLLLLSLTLHGQTTYVPDDQFENYIESQGWGNGIANDNYVNTAAVSTVTTLIMMNLGISDLTGIQDFSNLNYIMARDNNLTQVAFGNKPNLATVDLANNQLTSIDISGCPAITTLSLDYNQLTSLNVIQAPLLNILWVSNNQLTSLNLTANPLLYGINCSENQITNIQFGLLPQLNYLQCAFNQIQSLDLSNFPALTSLYCDNNQIASLNASACPGLQQLSCNENQVTALDVSGCPQLAYLRCSFNLITSLQLGSHPNLNSLICDHNQIQTLNLLQVPVVNTVICGANLISALDLSACPLISRLDCEQNQITTLTLSQIPQLEFLSAFENQISTIDLSGCPLLLAVDLSTNFLTSLDLSNNSQIQSLLISNNQIPAMDFSILPQLGALSISGNFFTQVDLSANPGLYYVNIEDNQLNCASVRSGNNTNLYYLTSTGNPNLSCLEVDDPLATAQNTNWNTDPFTQFSLDCSAACAGCALAVDAGNGVTVYPGLANIHMPCQGSQMSFNCATLSATVTGATGPVSYLWSNGATTPTITVCPTQATLYSVTVTTGPGCSATDEVWVNTCYTTSHNGTKVTIRNSQGNLITINIHALGAHLCNGGSLLNCGASAKTEEQPDAILIYPNPSSTGEFYLSIPETWTGQTARILDVTGRVLTEMDLGAGNQMINLSGYSKGIYFFSTELNGETRTIRLVY